MLWNRKQKRKYDKAPDKLNLILSSEAFTDSNKIIDLITLADPRNGDSSKSGTDVDLLEGTPDFDWFRERFPSRKLDEQGHPIARTPRLNPGTMEKWLKGGIAAPNEYSIGSLIVRLRSHCGFFRDFRPDDLLDLFADGVPVAEFFDRVLLGLDAWTKETFAKSLNLTNLKERVFVKKHLSSNSINRFVVSGQRSKELSLNGEFCLKRRLFNSTSQNHHVQSLRLLGLGKQEIAGLSLQVETFYLEIPSAKKTGLIYKYAGYAMDCGNHAEWYFLNMTVRAIRPTRIASLCSLQFPLLMMGAGPAKDMV